MKTYRMKAANIPFIKKSKSSNFLLCFTVNGFINILLKTIGDGFIASIQHKEQNMTQNTNITNFIAQAN